MRNDFGIGFGRELDALVLKFAAQLGEILDDAVMHHGDVFSSVRMGIVLGRPTMGRPAGMADADRAGKRLAREPGLEIFELTYGAPPREFAGFQRRDARGIIAAIFEALERID